MNKMTAEEYIYKKYPKEKGYNRHFNIDQTVQLLEGYAKQDKYKNMSKKDFKYKGIQQYEEEIKKLKEEIKRLKQTNNPK